MHFTVYIIETTAAHLSRSLLLVANRTEELSNCQYCLPSRLLRRQSWEVDNSFLIGNSIRILLESSCPLPSAVSSTPAGPAARVVCCSDGKYRSTLYSAVQYNGAEVTFSVVSSLVGVPFPFMMSVSKVCKQYLTNPPAGHVQLVPNGSVSSREIPGLGVLHGKAYISKIFMLFKTTLPSQESTVYTSLRGGVWKCL